MKVAAAACAAALALLPPCAALAQGLPQVNRPGGGIVAQPLPPPSQQLQPGQVLPAVPPAPGATPAPPPPAAAPAPVQPVQAGDWLPQGTAELRGIDKVMARTTPITVKLGETLRFGPLAAVVRACLVRPPDRAPDAAAFLEVSEDGKPPLFRGWMIASAPALAIIEHPTHDIRLFACKP
jgi:hypothetical protein